jgi:hypothetical protein
MQPIIPLVGSAANPQELAPWPVGKLDPESYQRGVAARFRTIVELETAGSRPKALLGYLGAWALQGCVTDFVIKQIKAYLSDAKL